MTEHAHISQQGAEFKFDVLVIGGGISGLQYILEMLKLNPNCNIALVTKKSMESCNSSYAQGGVAAVTAKNDSVAAHLADTIKAGDGLVNIKNAQKILEHANNSIKILLAEGVNFAEDKNKKEYFLAQEGGHSQRRIFHVGDCTGQAIIDAIINNIKKKKITLFENSCAINLITVGEFYSVKEVIGAYILDEKQNKINTFCADVVVLATGGAGKVYRYTSNLDVATGDGVAMAFRSGARISNMEFYQFHPTVLYHHTLNNFLITEAMRGEGAYLINPVTQKRFMQKYAPKELELATRDVVARAIFNEIESSNNDFVYLDMRHKSRKFLQTRFPKIFQQLLDLGIDLSKNMVPVIPAAHYMCGGIVTDINGQTDLARLYAIGETACTGLHGANRLASNSLLEGMVMAHFAAKSSVKFIGANNNAKYKIKKWNSKSATDRRRESQINANWRGLRGEMTSYAGIIRTQEGLKDLLTLIQARAKMIEAYYWTHAVSRDLIELRNIILISELIARSAFARNESRGGHYREDHPKKYKRAKNSIIRLRNNIIEIT